jgi:hypothetical protein
MRRRSEDERGLERSEVTPMETAVSLDGRRALPHGSVKCETPATTPCVVAGEFNLEALS